MKKIYKSEVRKIFHTRRSELALMLGVSINHINSLINYGDKGDHTRSKERGNALNGYQFRLWVEFLQEQGFSLDTALCMARFGIGDKNDRSRGIYYFEVDGQISDHDELQYNKYRRLGR